MPLPPSAAAKTLIRSLTDAATNFASSPDDNLTAPPPLLLLLLERNPRCYQKDARLPAVQLTIFNQLPLSLLLLLLLLLGSLRSGSHLQQFASSLADNMKTPKRTPEPNSQTHHAICSVNYNQITNTNQFMSRFCA
jgi:hypothetical protein